MTLQRRLRALEKEDIYFAQFSRNSTSQCGEDGILEEIFRLLPLSTPFPYCVDIGAWDGKHLSNTYTLLQEKDWGGLLVEANTGRCAEAQLLYADNSRVTCVNSFVALSGENVLVDILQRHNVKDEFDFLCIDVDGADYHLWQSITGSDMPTATSVARYRPKVVCIEFNPSIPHDIFYVQAADTMVQQGSSLLALQQLGKQLGYCLIVVTAFNGIFLREDLLPYMPENVCFPQDLDRIHVPHMTTSMFQTYDGELKFAGVKKLLWHGIAMNPQQLQVLPKKQRVYPFAPPEVSKSETKEQKKVNSNELKKALAKTTITAENILHIETITSISDIQHWCQVAVQVPAAQPLIACAIHQFVQRKLIECITAPSYTSSAGACEEHLLHFLLLVSELLLQIERSLQSLQCGDIFLQPMIAILSVVDPVIHNSVRQSSQPLEAEEVVYQRCVIEHHLIKCLLRTHHQQQQQQYFSESDAHQAMLTYLLLPPRLLILRQVSQLLTVLTAGPVPAVNTEASSLSTSGREAEVRQWMHELTSKIERIKLETL
jgi:hypothetical protein